MTAVQVTTGTFPAPISLPLPRSGAEERAHADGQVRFAQQPRRRILGHVSGPGASVHAKESPSWADVVRRAEHGETVAVIAHGEHVADVVPSGELDRLRDTVEALSDTDLVRDLIEGLADARAGRVFSADDVAADLAARRAAGE